MTKNRKIRNTIFKIVEKIKKEYRPAFRKYLDELENYMVYRRTFSEEAL